MPSCSPFESCGVRDDEAMRWGAKVMVRGGSPGRTGGHDSQAQKVLSKSRCCLEFEPVNRKGVAGRQIVFGAVLQQAENDEPPSSTAMAPNKSPGRLRAVGIRTLNGGWGRRWTGQPESPQPARYRRRTGPMEKMPLTACTTSRKG